MLLILTAAVLVTFVLWDVFVTIFSLSGAGPLTSRWTRVVWSALLFVHRRRPIHRLLSVAGPAMLFSTIIIWYALLGAALLMAVMAHPDSVINNNTGESVGAVEKLYFVTTTISSLGYGDLVPSRLPWTVVCTTASFLATVVLTVSLSYVLSVLAASIERRSLAQGIYGLGSTAPEIIDNARLHVSKDSMKEYVAGLCSGVSSQAMKHLAYPVLEYFHTPKPERSASRAVLLLSDAVFLMKLLPKNQQPPIGLIRLANSSLDSYVVLARSGFGTSLPESQGLGHLREAARQLELREGGAVDFNRALAEYLPRRQQLVEICQGDGWDVE